MHGMPVGRDIATPIDFASLNINWRIAIRISLYRVSEKGSMLSYERLI